MDDEEVQHRLRERVARSSPGEPMPRPAARILRHEDGRLHAALFGLLLIAGLHSGLDLRIDHVALGWVGLLVRLLLGVLVIAALVRQQGSDLPTAAKADTWTATGLMVLHLGVTYVQYIGVVFENPDSMQMTHDLFRRFSEKPTLGSPWTAGSAYCFLATYTLVGLLGLLHLWGRRAGTPAASTET